MQHVVVLAGSGASLGPAGGPSMKTLWNRCVNGAAGDVPAAPSEEASKVISRIGYQIDEEGENIEALLSRCEAWRHIHETDDDVRRFLTHAKDVILRTCRTFVDSAGQAALAGHRTFLHRLSRRRARDSRMKLFTTNYDACFESAAAGQGLVAIDGFSFSQPRRFDPRYFQYDIVRRPPAGDEVGGLLEGVFHLYKLHGSVDWSRLEDGAIEVDDECGADSACMIYPASGKYQLSYSQPHLEMVSQYVAALRQPNTCVLVVGFGFNDDHLSEPILAAVGTNPHLRLIVVDPNAEERAAHAGAGNAYWNEFLAASQRGDDVWLVNAAFAEFAEMIPDLGALTSAQRLARDIKAVAS